MTTNRLWRTLSGFNLSTRKWTQVNPRKARSQVPSNLLSLTSWNIDAFSPRAIARAKLILDHVLHESKPPDIIFLQEVTTAVRASLLQDAGVRGGYLVTDAEDQTAFENVPFATMTLLSRARFAFGSDSTEASEDDEVDGEGDLMIGRVSRMSLPSKYGRDALCVDLIKPAATGTSFRLINVHLDSLGHTLHYRAQQLEILANVLRESGCGGGIIAGDFNAISPEDEGLIDMNQLQDAWTALHGETGVEGATWGVGAKRRDGLGPGRLDKVAILGSKAEAMDVLRPGSIEVPRPGQESIFLPWSDHCGLSCSFTF
ncbi:hypothetical protein FA15DRAFT_667015 [Coprinopsis marcescibilis]|uniref:Endonuclease/exonuclease/phosphatase domain-containing protein n=1 Tax=Coprinopsis marcescibilis TaxID=230819 RepID=A0A5C3L2E3_COPMA|nr:hypothetical protein FA15DRAFT_667015 [Coprinopsis marcescibilis]